jgi:LysM repeat protein
MYCLQVLCLGLTGEDCTQTYVIQEGDYCWAIATSHDIDVNTLLVNNPNLDSECSNIYAGEVTSFAILWKTYHKL